MPATLQNCIPYHLFPDDNEYFCRWLDVADKSFDEPFFADTINICRGFSNNNKRLRCISALDVLPEWSPGMHAVEPTAIIFHVSRCGSTLLSQLLSLDPDHIVLSEVPFFDELLRLHYKTSSSDTQEHDKWLQSAIRFYGQKRHGGERHLFIKADCWHIFFYERLRKLYPDTPFVLLYRRPGEVLRSQQKRRGMQSVPGIVEPAIMGLELGEGHPANTDLDLYFSLVLEKILEAFCQVVQKDRNCLLVNYNEGMMPVLQKIGAFARVTLTEPVLEQMQERTRYHGKYPDQVFKEDPLTGMHDYLKESEAWYKKLEALRS